MNELIHQNVVPDRNIAIVRMIFTMPLGLVTVCDGSAFELDYSTRWSS